MLKHKYRNRNYHRKDASWISREAAGNSYAELPGTLLYHGDCLTVLENLPPNSIDLIVTDPAYSGMNNKLKLGRGRIVGQYQATNNEKWFPEFQDDPHNFRRFLELCHRVLRDNRHIYIMSDSFSLLSLGHLVREVFNMKNILVWDKVNIGMGHYFRRRHEFILFATKGHKKLSSKNIPDVWRIKRVSRLLYPTQKPVQLFMQMIKASAEPGYVVCDPFMGSGSAGMAALQSNCNFIGIDVSEKACRVTTARLQHYLQYKIDNAEQISRQVSPNEQISFL